MTNHPHRTILHADLENHPEHQGHAIEMWRRNPKTFIRDCIWTYDPRNMAVFPLEPFPRQDEYVEWLQEREVNQEDGIVEKCRDLGATWFCVAYALHHWLFLDGFKASFASRKAHYVDRLGDPDCIFEKLRFAYYRLPGWLWPKGFDERKHDTLMKFINPENGSTITGEAGDDIGRAGRSTMYFVDEAAYLEHPHKAEAALAFNADCKIYVSTPNGMGNPFARKRHSGDYPVFTFSWQDDPRKTQEWFDGKRKKLDPVLFAREVLIDYTASQEDTLIRGEWVQAAVEIDLPARGDLVAGLDVAEYGTSENVLTLRQGPVAALQLSWSGENTTQTAWRAARECEARGAEQLRYDSVGVGAGVTGTYESAESLPFQPVPVNAASAPSGQDHDGMSGTEHFLNLRAEMWWALRRRFEKTFERVTEGIEHPDHECISIQNWPELIQQLCAPKYAFTAGGKLKIEAKDVMRARGIKSPDHAESMALAFYEGVAVMPKGLGIELGDMPVTAREGMPWE